MCACYYCNVEDSVDNEIMVVRPTQKDRLGILICTKCADEKHGFLNELFEYKEGEIFSKDLQDKIYELELDESEIEKHEMQDKYQICSECQDSKLVCNFKNNYDVCNSCRTKDLDSKKGNFDIINATNEFIRKSKDVKEKEKNRMESERIAFLKKEMGEDPWDIFKKLQPTNVDERSDYCKNCLNINKDLRAQGIFPFVPALCNEHGGNWESELEGKNDE